MIYSKKIIIVIIVSLIILFVGIGCIFNKQTIEGLSNDSTTLCSCEAIQTVAGLYNKDTMTVDKLSVTKEFNLLPTGIIVAWTGTTDAKGTIITKAPDGWALCDGSIKGVPDLSGKFILGYGGSGKGKTIKGIGGKETVALTASQLPAHSHSLTGVCVGGNCPSEIPRDGGVFHRNIKATSKTSPYSGTYNTNLSGGKGQTHENMPPYYVLAYIMKL